MLPDPLCPLSSDALFLIPFTKRLTIADGKGNLHPSKPFRGFKTSLLSEDDETAGRRAASGGSYAASDAFSHPSGPVASNLPLLEMTLHSPRWTSAWYGSNLMLSPSTLM